MLQVGSNAALSTGDNSIYLMGGELRLDLPKGAYLSGDTQYAARNLLVVGANGIIRTSSLTGGGYSTVQINDIALYDDSRVLTISTVGTIFTNLLVNNITLNNNTTAVINQYLDVGVDNSFQTGAVCSPSMVSSARRVRRLSIFRKRPTNGIHNSIICHCIARVSNGKVHL